MNTLGIISEYNPFHKGHEYCIKTLKEKCNADYVVVVMSGDYTQRGCPAIFDKHTRCAMALAGGADLVFELPIYYSTGSAEFFAGGAISVLNGLGCVNYLGFGSESDDISSLEKTAKILAGEPVEFTTALKENLKSGKSFALARAEALKVCSDIDTDVLSTPNDILGIEYIKAILLQNSSIKPVSIKRIGAGYHDATTDKSFASATAIRNLLEGKDFASLTKGDLSSFIPSEALNSIFDESGKISSPIVTANNFSILLHYKLLSEKNNGFEQYLDVSREISDKIVSHINEYKDFTSFVELLKSKELTYTRINRALLHILLNITRENMDKYSPSRTDFVSYARILGFRKDSSELMKEIKETATIPVISRLSDAYSQTSELQMQLLNESISTSNIYDLVRHNEINEYSKKPIIF